jgi:hypothetical protein
LNGKYNIYKNLVSVQDQHRPEKEATNKGAVTPMITPKQTTPKTLRPSEALYPNQKGNI